MGKKIEANHKEKNSNQMKGILEQNDHKSTVKSCRDWLKENIYANNFRQSVNFLNKAFLKLRQSHLCFHLFSHTTEQLDLIYRTMLWKPNRLFKYVP